MSRKTCYQCTKKFLVVASARTHGLRLHGSLFPLLHSCISASFLFSICFSRFNQSRKIAETTNETKRVDSRVVYDKHASSIEQWSSERKILDMPTTRYFIASQHKPTCTQLPVERFEFSNSFWIILSNYAYVYVPMRMNIYLDHGTYIYTYIVVYTDKSERVQCASE